MDAERGSKRYRALLAIKWDGVEFVRPAQLLGKPEKRGTKPRSWGWFCRIPGSGITAGFGMTKNDAYVDFVEEAELLSVCFGGKPFTKGSGFDAILSEERRAY